MKLHSIIMGMFLTIATLALAQTNPVKLDELIDRSLEAKAAQATNKAALVIPTNLVKSPTNAGQQRRTAQPAALATTNARYANRRTNGAAFMPTTNASTTRSTPAITTNNSALRINNKVTTNALLRSHFGPTTNAAGDKRAVSAPLVNTNPVPVFSGNKNPNSPLGGSNILSGTIPLPVASPSNPVMPAVNASGRDATDDLKPADSILEKAIEGGPHTNNAVKLKEFVPFTADTQIRIFGVYEPSATNSPVKQVTGASNRSKYLVLENVPLKSVMRLLTRESGINYMEPMEKEAKDVFEGENITLEMEEPKPKDLLDSILKHRNLELFDAGTGVYTIRKYTNQLSYYRFKLTDNFMDRFKSSASGNSMSSGSSIGGGGGYGGYGGMGGGGNAVSANPSSITVEGGGKIGDVTQVLNDVVKEKEVENKIYYYEEKQAILLYGTKQASEKLSRYLEIANEKNPNIQVNVRIFATSADPTLNRGVDWSKMMSGGFTFALTPDKSGSTNSSAASAGSGLVPGFSLGALQDAIKNPMSSIVLRNDLAATLNFFVKDSSAESLSSPSAITANGREVAFAATQQIPYVSGSSVAGYYGGGGGVGYDQTASVSVGTTVNVLPRIQSENRIKLGTSIAVSQLDGWVEISSGTSGSGPRKAPQTSGRAFAGEFTINSGDTVVIAGMRSSTQTRNRSKVPFFGDIPLLGKAFSNQSDQKSTVYLTLFITVTIMDEQNQPRMVPGRLTREDFKATPESDISAERNMSIFTKTREYSDSAIVNARQEILEKRARKANEAIENRLRYESALNTVKTEMEANQNEIKRLDKYRAEVEKKSKSKRPLVPGEGNIESVKAEVATRLEKAKQENEMLAQQYRAVSGKLEEAHVLEKSALKDKTQAEKDLEKAFKEEAGKPKVRSEVNLNNPAPKENTPAIPTRTPLEKSAEIPTSGKAQAFPSSEELFKNLE